MILTDFDDYIIVRILSFAPMWIQLRMRATCSRMRTIVDRDIMPILRDPYHEQSLGFVPDEESKIKVLPAVILRAALRQPDSQMLAQHISLIWREIWSRDPRLILSDLYYAREHSHWGSADIFRISDQLWIVTKYTVDISQFRSNMAWVDYFQDQVSWVLREYNEMRDHASALVESFRAQHATDIVKYMREICKPRLPQDRMIYVPIKYVFASLSTKLERKIMRAHLLAATKDIIGTSIGHNFAQKQAYLCGKYDKWKCVSVDDELARSRIYILGIGYAAKYGRVAKYMRIDADAPILNFADFGINTSMREFSRDGNLKCDDFDSYEISEALLVSRAHPFLINLVWRYCCASIENKHFDSAFVCAQFMLGFGFPDFADHIVAHLRTAGRCARLISHDLPVCNMITCRFMNFTRIRDIADYDRYCSYLSNDARHEFTDLSIGYMIKSRGRYSDYFEMIRAMIRRYGREKMKNVLISQSRCQPTILRNYLAKLV